MMPWSFALFAALLGLIIGSFLNVVIARLPRMMEIAWQNECAESFPNANIAPVTETLSLSLPRSTCPHCHTAIRVRDNIPLLSWLWLKGRCHHCQHAISVRYPLVELLTALVSGWVAWHLGYSDMTLAIIALSWVLIAATFIDLDTMLLPDQLTLPLLWAGILLALLQISPVSLQDAVIGAMAGYLSLWSVYHLFRLITGKEGMGYGDFKLLAALGAWCGWQALPMIILLSSLVGVVFGLIQLRLQKQGINSAFPFGPYLAIAGWVALLWGNDIQQWYFHAVLGL
ncbi:prepilin peptidase [Vibrio agarilyticus]|nr:A24 family peptidase [Vibrio agarilyticus]